MPDSASAEESQFALSWVLLFVSEMSWFKPSLTDSTVEGGVVSVTPFKFTTYVCERSLPMVVSSMVRWKNLTWFVPTGPATKGILSVVLAMEEMYPSYEGVEPFGYGMLGM